MNEERASFRFTGLHPQGRIAGPRAWYNKSRMAGVEAYCVKCKQKREMTGAKEVSMGKDRLAMQGTCPVCGTKMFRIMGKKK